MYYLYSLKDVYIVVFTLNYTFIGSENINNSHKHFKHFVINLNC